MEKLTIRKQKEESEKLIPFVESWLKTKPKPPAKKKPAGPGTGMLWLGAVLIVTGFTIGVSYFITGSPSEEVGGGVWLLWLFAPLIGIVAGAVVAIGLNLGYIAMYQARLERSGWPKYDAAIEKWKLIGDEDFGEWAKNNFFIAIRLTAINEDYLSDFLQNRQAIDEDTPKQYIDDELGELEYALDNAAPAIAASLVMPSDKKLHSYAKYAAHAKRVAGERGERFLVQTSLPMKRAIGVNSAGWISTGSMSPSEQAQVVSRVKAIYQQYGLTVTKCWVGWKGMKDSAGRGAHEYFDLTIRLA